MKFLYPGHNYLGPGNDLINGPPVDKADEIAREHDYSYHNADNSTDIFKSDVTNTIKFAKDFIDKPNLPSFSGALGLGLKTYVESSLGQTIYPFEHNHFAKGANEVNKFLGGNDWFPKQPKRSIQEDEEMSEKKRKLSDSGSGPMEVSSTDGTNNNPQAGSGLPGGTGADVMATIIKNPHLPNSMFAFKKTWQFYTGAFQFATTPAVLFFDATTNPAFNALSPDTQVLITPLAALDPGMLPLYMSPYEYSQLPAFTHAKACRIKVTPLGYRLPFQTNEAAAGYANSQTLVQIAHSVGLNTMYDITATTYSIDPANPTVVTKTDSVEDDYVSKLYGNPDAAAGRIIGANVGVPVHLNLYTGILSCRDKSGALTAGETVNLIDNMQIQNVNDTKGVPIINFQHEFKNGLLNVPNQVIDSQRRKYIGTTPAPGTNVWAEASEGVNQTAFSTYNSFPNPSKPAGFGETGDTTNNSFDQQDPLTAITYNRCIEKSFWLQNQAAQHQTPDYTPLLHYGCMPVPNNPALATAETYSPCVIQWQVECELMCEVNLNSINPYYNIPYIKKWDPIYLYQDQPRNWGRVLTMANRRVQLKQSATGDNLQSQKSKLLIKK